MSYREHPPSGPLRALVECFWTRGADPDAAAPHRVTPDGCIDLLLRFGEAGEGAPPGATVVGAMTRPVIVPPLRRVELVGVRFRPGGAAAVLGLAAGEVQDADVDLEDVWGSAGGALHEHLACAASPGARLAALDAALTRRAAAAPAVDRRVRAAVELALERGGAVTVSELASAAGLGARQLERAFDRWVGLGPKLFCRVVRYRRAREAIARAAPGAPRWADLAAELGFSDQAHLVREFGELEGLSPGAYARELLSLSFNTSRVAVPIVGA